MPSTPREPLLNIPPLTLLFGATMLVCFGLLQLPALFEPAVILFSFVPKAFSQNPAQESYRLLTHAWLHFGWPHLIMNGFGLLAFGSGVERLMGKRIFTIVLFGGVIIGALGHWALYTQSTDPLGGASAGISALFGCILPLLAQRRDLIIATLVFIGMNVIIGTMGMADEPGLAIAWQAHIFGFAFGMLCFRFIVSKARDTVPAEEPPAPAATDEAVNPWQ